jgi:hypothetical protein
MSLSWAADTPEPPKPPAAPAPLQAGYDQGFFIKSGDNFELHIGTRIQLQFVSTSPDTFIYDSILGRQVDTELNNQLNIRRFKLWFAGYAFNPSIKFKLQLDTNAYNPGGSGLGNIRLEEAYVDFTAKPWTQLRVGQFKVPYGYEKMTSSGKLNLVDRSIVHVFFGVDQEPGVSLYGQSFGKHFRYDTSITVGIADNHAFSARNDLSATGKSDFRYIGRLTWEPFAPYTFEEGALSNPQSPELTLQFAVMTNQNTIPLDNDFFMPAGYLLSFNRGVLGAASATFPAATDTQIASTLSQSRKPYDRNEIEAVAAYKYHRFAIEAQGNGGKVNPDTEWISASNPDFDDLDFKIWGYRIQPSFFLIPTRLEVAGRWAEVERKSTADFITAASVEEKIVTTEWRVGLNWYFLKQDLKWQFDFGQIGNTWSLNGQDLAVPQRADFPNGTGYDNRVISNNTRTDTEFRTQLQFQF